MNNKRKMKKKREKCVKENCPVLEAHKTFRMNYNVSMEINFGRKRSPKGKKLQNNLFSFSGVYKGAVLAVHRIIAQIHGLLAAILLA
jgi:hypothetical protein